MTKNIYTMFEKYMLSCMGDSAHDREHVYRVLYNALEIAGSEKNVDFDILICACLLHDIGRKEQFENPKLCHAQVGGDKAYAFLTAHGFSEEFSDRVRECIKTHRFRREAPPRSIEAKILFDADKIEAAGTIGIARTLVYKGKVGEPLYSLKPDGTVSDGENDGQPSFFQEYKYKLEKIYSGFMTERGRAIAEERRKNAVDFYNNMLDEVKSSYENGIENLRSCMENGNFRDKSKG